MFGRLTVHACLELRYSHGDGYRSDPSLGSVEEAREIRIHSTHAKRQQRLDEEKHQRSITRGKSRQRNARSDICQPQHSLSRKPHLLKAMKPQDTSIQSPPNHSAQPPHPGTKTPSTQPQSSENSPKSLHAQPSIETIIGSTILRTPHHSDTDYNRQPHPSHHPMSNKESWICSAHATLFPEKNNSIALSILYTR